MPGYEELSTDINRQIILIHDQMMELWKEYVLFDWHWWFGVLITLVSILAWWFFHDRRNQGSLLLAGLTAAVCSATFDTAGHYLGLFDYHYGVIPLIHNYIPWDFIFIPVLVMFTVQLFPTRSFILRGIVLSALISFVGLPFLHWIDIYQLLDWRYVYSFISMFIIFLVAYGMSRIRNRSDL
ncbi:CBO0543 family protein [Salibacterium lacus]|uniref:CBO0543 family protein n=1 Tax=Salibacterium lacus TaxID=1898109 RepID=A0ABW5T5S8_9BACI